MPEFVYEKPFQHGEDGDLGLVVLQGIVGAPGPHLEPGVLMRGQDRL